MDKQKLQTILDSHKLWLESDKKEGVRADLSFTDLSHTYLRDVNLIRADLREANLESTDLRGADLIDANLRGANLSLANLRGTDLSLANLRGANLSLANLRGTDLRGATLESTDLRGADLIDANLRGANLSLANLRGVKHSYKVPIISNIHKAVYAAASKPDALNMFTWHSECGTTHCRAGWVITLAGEEGVELERTLLTNAAAALIYYASDPSLEHVPEWFVNKTDALADMKMLQGAE